MSEDLQMVLMANSRIPLPMEERKPYPRGNLGATNMKRAQAAKTPKVLVIDVGGTNIKMLATGQKVDFDQDTYRVSFKGLPEKAPDDPITTLAIECEAEPKQDELFVRRRERGTV